MGAQVDGGTARSEPLLADVSSDQQQRGLETDLEIDRPPPPGSA